MGNTLSMSHPGIFHDAHLLLPFDDKCVRELTTVRMRGGREFREFREFKEFRKSLTSLISLTSLKKLPTVQVAHLRQPRTPSIRAPGAKRLSPLFSTDAAEREQRVLVLYAEPRGGRATFRWVKGGLGEM